MLSRIVKTRLRMCPADRDAYGGPEWVVFDPDALAELPGSKLEEIETTTGFRIAWFWIPSLRISARGQRAALWVARKMAGLVDEWDQFDPRILLADAEPVPDQPTAAGPGDDEDPPAGGSPGGSPAAP